MGYEVKRTYAYEAQGKQCSGSAVVQCSVSQKNDNLQFSIIFVLLNQMRLHLLFSQPFIACIWLFQRYIFGHACNF